MKRISKETFCKMGYETAIAIRIENGEFYFLADMEEWPDSPDFNKLGRRIFAPYSHPVLLNRILVSEGILDVLEAPDYETTPMTYYYETKEECKDKNIYEAFMELVNPYERNEHSEPDDYDIFILSKAEFMDTYDVFRDGDYVFIIEDVNVEKHLIGNEIAINNNLRIGSTVYYVYDDVFHKGVISTVITKITAEEFVLTYDNMHYTLKNKQFGKDFFLTKKEAMDSI